MNLSSFILLSFDVEEFDLPLEYHQPIHIEEQFSIGKQGLDAVAPIISNKKIHSTLFTTANFAIRFPEAIKLLAQQHEIASHTFYHTTFKNEDLLSSRLKLEEISGTKVSGLRMPRMRAVEMSEVKKAGYNYDSSINPTILPGRYNNLHLPRTLYSDDGVNRLPASVSPNLRIPLFWLAFKNFPYPLFRKLAIQTLKHDGYICLYFHPWEFTNINQYHLPGYVKRLCGEPLQKKLTRLITDLSNEGDFISIQEYINQKAPL
jgi:peptidoglycan/xylan/chitin deacetylase (PgdA/CDA1 family)